jgi:hypothetical protein
VRNGDFKNQKIVMPTIFLREVLSVLRASAFRFPHPILHLERGKMQRFIRADLWDKGPCLPQSHIAVDGWHHEAQVAPQ